MKSIIGLFDCDVAVQPAVKRLKEAGIADERIQILSNTKTIHRMLGVDLIGTSMKYTLWGAGIGIGIYGICGLAAAFCECSLMHYGQEYGVFAFLGAVLAGTFIGGFIGIVVGAGEIEKDTYLYIRGVSFGGKVISIQVAESEAERVQSILAMENVMGIKVLQLEGA